MIKHNKTNKVQNMDRQCKTGVAGSSQQNELCCEVLKEKIDSVHEEIYGNGNSNNSLVTRMARVETNMKLLLTVSITQFFMLMGIAIEMFFGR